MGITTVARTTQKCISALVQASTKSGRYCFQIGDFKFSTLVENGWLLIAVSNAKDGRLEESTVIEAASGRILPQSILRAIAGQATEVRISALDTEVLDITSSNLVVLQRLRRYQPLVQAAGEESLWEIAQLKFNNTIVVGCATAPADTLPESIFDTCLSNGLAWGTSLGVGLGLSLVSSTDKATELRLWVRG